MRIRRVYVLFAMPQRNRGGDRGEIESPRPKAGEIVIQPAEYPSRNRSSETCGYKVADSREDLAVHIRPSSERLCDVGRLKFG